MSFKRVFLADDKMANISLDVDTFIAQNIPNFFILICLHLSVSSIIL